MRTTLDIDEDVLVAAKKIARMQRRTAGAVLSDLARKAIQDQTVPRILNGVPLLTPISGAPVLTMELVDRLLHESE